jgi:SAM-dependent methyltransferase
MTQNDRDLLRSTFNQDAERYDRARPGYPAGLFDDLAELTSIGPGSRVLEIGPGTGQATRPLAERGCRVVAVELGADLAALARRNLAGFPSVDVVNAAFEDWPLPAEPFDLVLAATAFHWIDPSVRVNKVADALRPGGFLATVSTHHVAGGDESFFAEVQDCYVRFDPDTPSALTLKPATDIPSAHYGLDQSSRFGPATLRRYEMGPAVHDRRLHRSPPHLLRTPRPRPRTPAQPARLHRPPDRHWLRRPDHQALPDRAAGRSDRRPSIHGSGVVGGPPPGSVRCAASRPAELVQETSHSALSEPRPQFRRVPGQLTSRTPPTTAAKPSTNMGLRRSPRSAMPRSAATIGFRFT